MWISPGTVFRTGAVLPETMGKDEEMQEKTEKEKREKNQALPKPFSACQVFGTG
jgi:hypothetical protein